MQNGTMLPNEGRQRYNLPGRKRLIGGWRAFLVIAWFLAFAVRGFSADSSDTLLDVLDILQEKGLLTEAEAARVKALAEARRTNAPPQLPPIQSKWKIGDAIKRLELFGDLRLRYEDRQAHVPDGGRVELDRGRYSVRIGLRGDAFDNVYYGVRVETASNPRSPWVTFGTSSSGIPYQGPFGKSTGGINIGQVYLGLRPTDWLDITVGKMANPLYTTPMVWDSDLNPEGAAERFKYTVGQADFFATFGQFLYQDNNPSLASAGLGFNGGLAQSGDTLFQLAWQGGVNYHFAKDVSAKVAATLYNYIGLDTDASPYFGDTFVGEGSYQGPGSVQPYNGYSGYGTSSTFFNYSSLGFPNNQVGVNDLLILEIPFEVDFKLWKHDARFFGDVAYNLEGKQRAEAAAAGYNYFLQNASSPPATIRGFSPQRNDVMAYQFGFALGNMGLVYGTTSKKGTWEARAYWQHVEQYALDPNLLDSDFFEGRGNLEGVYAALAYGFTDNVIGTLRYGHANRINKLLGTGGSNQDMPQLNPIQTYNLMQLDLTFRF
jgi:hypothetical protein